MAEQAKPEQEKLIRIVWGSPDGVPVHYANHMSVSYAGGSEFHITFGHLSPPYEGFEAAELPEKLTVKPIVTIVTSPDVMRMFVRVLLDNVTNFEKILEERKKK